MPGGHVAEAVAAIPIGLLDIGVPLDILVYTPGEFAKMNVEENGFWKEVQSAIIRIL